MLSNLSILETIARRRLPAELQITKGLDVAIHYPHVLDDFGQYCHGYRGGDMPVQVSSVQFYLCAAIAL